MARGTGTRRTDGDRRRFRIPRSSILFFTGLALLIYEATGRGVESPRIPLIAAYILMMGIPLAEASDMFRNRIIRTWDEDDNKDAGDDKK